VTCLAFTFLFTAFQSLQALQTSLFIHEGMGTTILALIYGSLVLSAFFLPAPLVSLLGEVRWRRGGRVGQEERRKGPEGRRVVATGCDTRGQERIGSTRGLRWLEELRERVVGRGGR